MDRLFDFEIDPMTQDEKAFFKAMGAALPNCAEAPPSPKCNWPR